MGEQEKQLETLVKLLQPARIQSSQLNPFNLQLIAISAKAMGNCKLQLQLANKLALKTFSLGAMLTFYDQEKSHCYHDDARARPGQGKCAAHSGSGSLEGPSHCRRAAFVITKRIKEYKYELHAPQQVACEAPTHTHTSLI